MVLPIIMIAVILVVMLICIVFDLKLKIRKFEISLYWFVCLIGAIICACAGFIKTDSLKNVFISSDNINPIKILVIFFACTSISVLLDQIGFFKYVAQLALQKAKSSQIKLFFVFNAIIAILTVFTSNDILILTFTPFICYFTKKANIDPIPFIVSEFVTANAWSMFFYIDNPTNIYLCTLYDISFVQYVIKMFLPTIVAGGVSLLILFLLFRKKLKQPIVVDDEEIVRPNKSLLSIGLIGLISMVAMMIISPYIGLDIWYVPPVCAGLTYIVCLIYLLSRKMKIDIITNALKKLPYSLIPFLISMAIIVGALKDVGAISSIGELLSKTNFIVVGLIAFVVGNLMNNIPMSMFFASILGTFAYSINMVYSVVIASNICAFLTPIGALAGIMFMNILKSQGVKYSFTKFSFYGLITSIPTLLLSMLMLYIPL